MTCVANSTVAKLLLELGAVCSAYQVQALRDLPCKRLQFDEIWSFCDAKSKNVPAELKGEPCMGDVWTWTANCAETKLIPSWQVGTRDAATAFRFIDDLSNGLANRVQLSTDWNRVYLEAVEHYIGCDIDYDMLIKHYGGAGDQSKPETRYSPGSAIRTSSSRIMGEPDPKHVSTSYAERANLTMQMCMRRFTRLTNAFSKKIENHRAAVSLHFMYYSVVCRHQTLRVTPAMATGVTNRLWSVEDVVARLPELKYNTRPRRGGSSQIVV